MKVCLVSAEILGAHKNGGIGTATSNLAVLLARRGHEVTLFYIGEGALERGHPWTGLYKESGVSVVHAQGPLPNIMPNYLAESVWVYEMLRHNNFDCIIFHEWRAIGFSCVTAKAAGMDFAETALITVTHSNTSWLKEANGEWFEGEGEIARAYTEQKSVELSDAVISPSQHLFDWMKDVGWKLPDRALVAPYYLSAAGNPVSAGRSGSILKPTVAFFGRLEERKGIHLFLDALGHPTLQGEKFNLMFLGREVSIDRAGIEQRLRQRKSDVLDGLRIETNLHSDQAIELLLETGAVAIMPSLTDNSPCVVYECVQSGVPFLASRAGGIPEILDPADRERRLFESTPAALAAKLREALRADSWPPPKLSANQDDVGVLWAEFLERVAASASNAELRDESTKPTVSVVVTHHERPGLLRIALEGLAGQTDRDFELVLVDDGSTSEAACSLLDELESCAFQGLKINVLRQQNRYLGAARNAGWRAAVGHYVIFLDDDNVPFPRMVEVFRRAVQTSGADIVTCQSQLFEHESGWPDVRAYGQPQAPRWGWTGGPIGLGAVTNCFGDATAIYKRSVLEQIGGFHERYGVTYEDWDLFVRAKNAGATLLSLPAPLFWYRVRPQSMLRSTSRRRNANVLGATYRRILGPELASLAELVLAREFSS